MPDNASTVNLQAGQAAIGGDVAGRDKIVSTVIYQGVVPGQVRRGELPLRQPFFGREDELAQIAAALDPETRGWGALIDGPGGIGKTALAIEAGHRAPAEHFSSKIFLSAKVRELTPAGEVPLDDFMLPNYQALMIELGRELGIAEVAQPGPGSRAAEIRRALENRKALLIFDNLETLEEAERSRLYQFLSRLPASCKAVVTSRRRDDVEARVIRLDRLSAPAAQALMASLAERNPLLARAGDEERRELYETAQGNPLLIKWVAGQLGRGRCRTVADACRFLGAAPVDNDPLEFIFGDLVDTFTDNELKALAALSHFGGLARFEWVGETAGIAAAAARTALEDLADRALLIAGGESGLFYLPPLVAKFLRSKQPEVVSETGERLTNQVFEFLYQGEETIHSPARFPQVEAQWSRIAAALEVFLQGDNVRLQLLCGTLDRFCEFSGRWDEWLSLCQRAEERAVAANDTYNAGQRAYQAGYIFGLRGAAEESAACADRAEAYWHNATDDVRASVLLLRAGAFRLQGRSESARVAAQAALAIFRAAPAAATSVVSVLNELATVEAAAGNLEQAEVHLNEAMRAANLLPMEYLALTVTSLAHLQLVRARWGLAEGLAQDALTLAERVQWQLLVGRACQALAAARLAQGRGEAARPPAQRALDIFARLRTPDWPAAADLLRRCESGTWT